MQVSFFKLDEKLIEDKIIRSDLYYSLIYFIKSFLNLNLHTLNKKLTHITLLVKLFFMCNSICYQSFIDQVANFIG